MTTVPSKRYGNQKLIDLGVILSFILLIGALLLGAHVGTFTPAAGKTMGNLSNGNGILAGSDASFTADKDYWSANCSHGWNSDERCDLIFARAQSCSISTASAYCSEYDSYLQRFK